MTTQQNNQNTIDSRLKEMERENELLLVQIHQLEEELEHYFIKNQELEKGQLAGSQRNEAGRLDWIDDELPDALAENKRLEAIVEVLQKTHQLEAQNSLKVKLGNILIQGVDSPRTLLAVPGKLGKIWRESRRKSPPHSLGGKEFGKVIEVYGDGGFKAVEKLITAVSLAPTIQANAYTALARHVMNSDRTATTVAARSAYELDPQPYRLKWLAFRLHEAGEVIEAEAMLDVLPPDIQFSESEARQAAQLHHEAKHVRLSEAKQKTRISERRTEIERQLKLAEDRQAQIEHLSQAKTQEEEEHELLLHQLFQAQEELESQYLKCQALEQEKSALVAQQDKQAKLAEDRQAQIEHLSQAKTQEEEEHELLLHQLFQAQEEFENQNLKCQALEQENSALLRQKNEQAKLAADRQAQIEQLTQAKAAVEAERGREIESLKQAQTKLEVEKSALAGQKDEQAKLAADRQAQIEQLTQAKAAVEAERGREIESLKQLHAAQLEKEKSAFAKRQEEAEKLMARLQNELHESRQAASISLKLQMLREADLKDLQIRYQASRSKEEQQHQLLTKLGERLSTASAYFHQITKDETSRLSRERRQIQAVAPTRKSIAKDKSQS